jgi:hypothetical protein
MGEEIKSTLAAVPFLKGMGGLGENIAKPGPMAGMPETSV